MFSLDQLRGFVTVAQELHFGRAAERLHVTQPALSRQIKSLEGEVRIQLLERNNRRVALTPAGAAFLVDAQRLLALAQSAPSLARRIAEGKVGSVRMGFTAGATYEVLPTILERLGAALPDIEINLHEMVTRELLAALREGELDLGVARPLHDDETFEARPIQREELVVVVPADHRLAGLDRPVDVTELAREPLVMYTPTRGRYLYDLVVRLVPIDHQNVIHALDQITTMVMLVSAGRGIAFVPASTSRLGVAGVRYLPLAGLPERPVEMHLIWPREARNPALSRLLHELRDVQAGSSGRPPLRG